MREAALYGIRPLVCQGEYCLLWLAAALQGLRQKHFTSSTTWSVIKLEAPGIEPGPFACQTDALLLSLFLLPMFPPPCVLVSKEKDNSHDLSFLQKKKLCAYRLTEILGRQMAEGWHTPHTSVLLEAPNFPRPLLVWNERNQRKDEHNWVPCLG